MRIGMVGTRGVPARYGGFETCVEEVGRRLVERGHEVVVYCRGDRQAASDSYLGMRCVHLPAARKRTLETLTHTAASVAHLAKQRVDVAFVFNAANAPLLPAIRALRIPVATHVDGLEWKRSKWSGTGKRYYRGAEALAVRWSDALIADAQGIVDYYGEQFSASTELISYGAPLIAPPPNRLPELGLQPRSFHLVVARFEPENHVLEIVQGYARSPATIPLVVVGSAPYSDDYTRRVHEAADSRVRFVGGVWDQELLDQLYTHCCTYLHGHSVGGTNPSLLRAMGAGACVNAFDVNFNREVLAGAGEFFADPARVGELVIAAESDLAATAARGSAARQLARRYDWDNVASAYEELAKRLQTSGPSQSRPSGRRFSPA